MTNEENRQAMNEEISGKLERLTDEQVFELLDAQITLRITKFQAMLIQTDMAKRVLYYNTWRGDETKDQVIADQMIDCSNEVIQIIDDVKLHDTVLQRLTYSDDEIGDDNEL